MPFVSSSAFCCSRKGVSWLFSHPAWILFFLDMSITVFIGYVMCDPYQQDLEAATNVYFLPLENKISLVRWAKTIPLLEVFVGYGLKSLPVFFCQVISNHLGCLRSIDNVLFAKFKMLEPLLDWNISLWAIESFYFQACMNFTLGNWLESKVHLFSFLACVGGLGIHILEFIVPASRIAWIYSLSMTC